MKLKSFDSYLFSQLQDPQFAMLYLSEAYADSTEEFLVALGKYVQAKGGIDEAAASGQISREALTTILSNSSSPEQRSLVLQSIHLGLILAGSPSPVAPTSALKDAGRRSVALQLDKGRPAKPRRKVGLLS